MNNQNPTIDSPGRETAPTEPNRPGASAPQPAHIGRYRVERPLGQGGFGAVWLAYDEQLSRHVAIKVPHAHLLARADAALAYLAEARAVARLDHANVVPVFDFGSTDQLPCFIVSKYIDGSSLAGRLRESRLPLRDAVELVALVADALHHAHRQGLVHRDIKPSNILLDKTGKPFVADFGLALREQDVGKGPGYVGTPGYMSPEQAGGEGHRVDGRSDIFSLGVVFYELLTGARPFSADDREELLAQIRRGAVRPPRQRDDDLPKELERICLKALSRRAIDRYTTAKDMAEDLRHYLEQLSGSSTGPRAREAADASGHIVPEAAVPPAVPADTRSRPIKIVPKGLRSFDVHDADFFLELLPGPRDRDGLPDSIRFWKNRIEERDADSTFAVGLIYGPSGCGKSSLVKAGLLPRLAEDVVAVYVEATARETETRLLHGLRRRCAMERLAGLGLKETLTALRRGQGLPAGKKVLIILDQLEQWLHAEAALGAGTQRTDGELVAALRQCDGARVQCILLVRDDFWLAVSRFMKELEAPLLEGQNSALVDLFDPDHARNVLAAFGRAYGKLPQSPCETTREQHQFLEQAVAGLTQEDKVICVRLALFAETIKNKTWTPASLRAVGGTAGVGVTFLEETFSAASAPPSHRRHQQAARNVLKALIPEAGTDIKGHMRSYQELLAQSGYESRPEDFDDLLHILDGELRLITPTNPESSEDSSSQAQAGKKCYQLTHDYLVHSLRDWLTRKQKETRRGRAEMVLADRAHEWTARPERRQLPGLREWLSIRLLTRPRTWTDGQRAMMRAAARMHLARAGGVLGAVVALLIAGLFFRAHLEEERAAARADATVRRLLDAKTAEIPAIIDELAGQRRWADPLLEKVLADPAARSDRKLHARLALLPGDAGHVASLRESLLQADASDFPYLRDALAPYRADLVEGFWQILESARDDPRRRFRAAAALATYDPSARRWQAAARWVAEQLVTQPSLALPHWVDALRPIKEQLVPALLLIARERSSHSAASMVVAEVIGDYAAEQPRILAEALSQADPSSFAVLFTRLRPHGDRAVAALTALLDKTPPDDGPAANATASQRASLAIALLRLGAGERLWPLLKASDNPRARSFAIDRFAALGCPPDLLLARLDLEPDDSIRAALWLGLGGFDEAALPAARRLELRPRLLDVYRRDASAAAHAAVHWLLGKWSLTAPAIAPGESGKRWYVNRAGQTMVRFAGPVTFIMGPAPGERGPDQWEKRHQARIDYAFDIGMTEVTAGQFQRFLDEREGHAGKSPAAKLAGASADKPAVKVSWYLAAEYCNWLSKAENIPREQWCYEPNEKGEFADGMKIVAGYQRRAGYRLTTETEWEYACRGGAATSRCYGDADALLPRYAWYADSSDDQYAPVARLLPNAFGLFDMHGNVSEWCQDESRAYDDRRTVGTAEVVRSENFRCARGGNILSLSRMVRSAKRFADRPTYPVPGFRVARSRP
jgi:serine/threonine protein kinase/formylglycine-generating enzyme required for sulfatase activity